MQNRRFLPPVPLAFGSMNKSANQVITTGVNTKVNFDNTLNNYRVTVDIANSQFIIQEKGLYQVSFWGQWAASLAGTIRGYFIYLNGVNTWADEIPAAIVNTGAFNYGLTTEPVILQISDLIECHVVHNTGANLNFVASSGFPRCSIVKLSEVY